MARPTGLPVRSSGTVQPGPFPVAEGAKIVAVKCSILEGRRLVNRGGAPVSGRAAQHYLLAGITGGVLLFLLIAILTLDRRPPAVRTHRDAIAHVLHQRGVNYREITFSQTWEESVNLRAFNAAVQVHLADGQTVHGWIGCEQGEKVCFLVLRGIGITGERLPDIQRSRRPAWQNWLDRVTAWLNEQVTILVR